KRTCGDWSGSVPSYSAFSVCPASSCPTLRPKPESQILAPKPRQGISRERGHTTPRSAFEEETSAEPIPHFQK
ncbi:hypothetical protein BB560_007086, partial [Smittium megazygosporum]